MNGELEVRESSLSYVIGLMNHGNRGTMIRAARLWYERVWYSTVCYGERTEMGGHVGRG